LAKKRNKKRPPRAPNHLKSSIIGYIPDSTFQMISRSAWTPRTIAALSLIKIDVCQRPVEAC